MRERTATGLRYTDWITFSLYLCMMGIGWFMLISVGNSGAMFDDFLNQPAGKQGIWIVISVIAFFLIYLIRPRFWQLRALYIYGFSLLLLILVLLVGTEIKGSRSWFSLGGLSFQPAELAKFGTALALSYYLSQFNVQIKERRHLVTSLLLVVIPTLLILLQPDAGSALVFLSFFILFFRAGLSVWYYVIALLLGASMISGLYFEEPWYPVVTLASIGILAIAVLFPRHRRRNVFIGLLLISAGTYWAFSGQPLAATLSLLGLLIAGVLRLYKFNRLKLGSQIAALVLVCSGISFAAHWGFDQLLQPHQQDRINVWLHQESTNSQGSSYNLVQSKTAIGSGGILGKGYGKGTMTKFRHVPEQSTDFIFCTVGEEQGFVGSALLILLFLWLFQRLISLAERQQSLFTRYYAYGVLGILFVHFFVNIGMTIGLVPIIGIPLPFISKGGSSLLGFTLMMAVLLKMDSKRFQMT